MQLHVLDLGIVAFYLVGVVIIGFYLARLASRDIDSYFLADNQVPWYFLGMSNASSMFDIAGTMWLVSVLFIYGMQGAWVPWLWPLFNQIFLMVYLSVWIRRSGVLTGAEWITTRFGAAAGGELSRISVLIFALISVIGFLAYAFQGIGRFASVFLPFGYAPETYAVIFMAIATLYVILGGIYSVIVTDIIQFFVLSFAAVVVGYLAFTSVQPDVLQAAVPDGWFSLFSGWGPHLEWDEHLPAVTERLAEDGWDLFYVFFMMVAFKGVLVSAAGPTPNYDMQRILAAKSPREGALMSGLVSVCTMPRWFLIAGVVTMALAFFKADMAAMGAPLDFELLLPWVISEFVPIGLTGILIAGLLAAFMSTFDSTVNAGASYLVNDFYKRYINPSGSDRSYIRASYIASFAIVVVGISFGFMSHTINTVTQWIVAGLYAGYTAPNVLKWHWWRFNGHGYFWGMISGILAALFFPVLTPELGALDAFPFIMLISVIFSVAASLLTAPTDRETLKRFYANVRPWGFWGPVHDSVQEEYPGFEANTSMKRDMINVLVGIAWQTSLIVAPISLIFFEYTTFSGALVVMLVTTVFLKINWYDRLERPEDDTSPDQLDMHDSIRETEEKVAIRK